MSSLLKSSLGAQPQRRCPPAGPFTLPADNLERQIATGHVGPFLLTKLLAPTLLAAGTGAYTPRVVFVASIAEARGTGVDFHALAHPDAAAYTRFGAYLQTRTVNVLSARELAKRTKGALNA